MWFLRAVGLTILVWLFVVFVIPWLITVKVGDGVFHLNLEVDSDLIANDQSLSSLVGWNDNFVSWAMEAPWTDGGTEDVRWISPRRIRITIPFSTRTGPFSDKYTQPKYLILDYRLRDNQSEKPRRKLIEIPPGRGDRSMAISLRDEK